jgi:AraC family transcriptional regulator of adaptative response / DNA-3-methyladenine glycosylase II
VRGFAEAVASGELDLTEMGELDAICARLESLKGVGPWTAQLMAMRLHHHPSAFPSSDVGLRAGAVALGHHDRPTVAQLEALATNWMPWRAHAATHLWHAAANPPLAGSLTQTQTLTEKDC